MSDSQDEVRDLVAEVLTEACTAELVESSEGGWADELWKVMAELGLTAVGIDEEYGGSGGDLEDAAAVIRVAASFAAPLPLAHTLIVAPFVRSTFGLAHREGPSAVAVDSDLSATAEESGWRLRGTIVDVAYGRVADSMILTAIAADGALIAAQVQGSDLVWTTAENGAGEPRDSANIDIVADDVATVPASDAARIQSLIRDREAISLAWAMVGAMERVRDLTIDYTTQREQFGRALARFQAVKQLASVIAGEVAVTAAAVGAATRLLVDGENQAGFAVAAARLRAAGAVAPVSQAAHQLHGAIGYTREYPLHQYTRRLWSWRDEGLSERQWMTVTGERGLANGADRLWESIAV